MALKSYQADTLNDNWFEERAKPLKGVLADYGHTSFQTTNMSAYVKPNDVPGHTGSSHAEWKKKLHEARKLQSLSMVSPSTYHEASRERLTKAPEVGFGAILPKHSGEEEKRMLTSSYHSDFGTGTRQSETQKRMMRSSNAPMTTGSGGQRMDKGTNTSGAIGEKYSQTEDPKRDTAAQRSWMYTEDPMLYTKRRGVPTAKPVNHMSLPLHDSNNKSFNPNTSHARRTLITGTSGTGQFYDE